MSAGEAGRKAEGSETDDLGVKLARRYAESPGVIDVRHSERVVERAQSFGTLPLLERHRKAHARGEEEGAHSALPLFRRRRLRRRAGRRMATEFSEYESSMTEGSVDSSVRLDAVEPSPTHLEAVPPQPAIASIFRSIVPTPTLLDVDSRRHEPHGTNSVGSGDPRSELWDPIGVPAVGAMSAGSSGLGTASGSPLMRRAMDDRIFRTSILRGPTLLHGDSSQHEPHGTNSLGSGDPPVELWDPIGVPTVGASSADSSGPGTASGSLLMRRAMNDRIFRASIQRRPTRLDVDSSRYQPHGANPLVFGDPQLELRDPIGVSSPATKFEGSSGRGDASDSLLMRRAMDDRLFRAISQSRPTPLHADSSLHQTHGANPLGFGDYRLQPWDPIGVPAAGVISAGSPIHGGASGSFLMRHPMQDLVFSSAIPEQSALLRSTLLGPTLLKSTQLSAGSGRHELVGTGSLDAGEVRAGVRDPIGVFAPDTQSAGLSASPVLRSSMPRQASGSSPDDAQDHGVARAVDGASANRAFSWLARREVPFPSSLFHSAPLRFARDSGLKDHGLPQVTASSNLVRDKVPLAQELVFRASMPSNRVSLPSTGGLREMQSHRSGLPVPAAYIDESATMPRARADESPNAAGNPLQTHSAPRSEVPALVQQSAASGTAWSEHIRDSSGTAKPFATGLAPSVSRRVQGTPGALRADTASAEEQNTTAPSRWSGAPAPSSAEERSAKVSQSAISPGSVTRGASGTAFFPNRVAASPEQSGDRIVEAGRDRLNLSPESASAHVDSGQVGRNTLDSYGGSSLTLPHVMPAVYSAATLALTRQSTPIAWSTAGFTSGLASRPTAGSTSGPTSGPTANSGAALVSAAPRIGILAARMQADRAHPANVLSGNNDPVTRLPIAPALRLAATLPVRATSVDTIAHSPSTPIPNGADTDGADTDTSRVPLPLAPHRVVMRSTAERQSESILSRAAQPVTSPQSAPSNGAPSASGALTSLYTAEASGLQHGKAEAAATGTGLPSGMNMDDLIEQISRRLLRQLVIDRERRGASPWR